MNKNLNCQCKCTHCKEIENQKDRLETWQIKRLKFNKFIEIKAVEAKPDLSF